MTGDELKAIRMSAEVTQGAFAAGLGLTPQFVGMMERGERPIDRRTELAAIYLHDPTAGECLARVEAVFKDIVPEAKCELWDYRHKVRCGTVLPSGQKVELSMVRTTAYDEAQVQSAAQVLRMKIDAAGTVPKP